MMSVIEECVVMPCMPPTIVQPLDHAHPHVHVERDVDALADLVPEHVDGAVLDHDPRRADVDAVELRALHGDAVEDRAVDVLDVDAVLAAEDGDVAMWTSSWATTIPPFTTAPGEPWSTSRRRITIGPWCTPAARWTTGGRRTYHVAALPTRTSSTPAAATPPARPSSPPSSA
jgi:hypothetical protein